MSKNWTRVLIILLLPVILLVAVAVYYRLQVQQTVDLMIESLAPQLQLNYDSMSGGLDGSVELSGVVLSVAESPAQLKVESVVIRTAGWEYLLAAAEQLDQGLWPSQLSVDLNRAELALNPANIPTADRLLSELVPQNTTVGLLAMACGGHKPFSFQQMHEMGITRLSGLLQFSYQHNPGNGQFSVQLRVRPEQMFNLDFDLHGSSAAAQLSTAMLDSIPPVMRDLDIHYQDQGYHQQRNLYCAGLDDDIVAQYIKLHSGRVRADLAEQNWRVPHLTAIAYQMMMNTGGRVDIKLNPEPELVLSKQGWLELLDEADRWRRLNIDLMINQIPQDLLAMMPAESQAEQIVAGLLRQTAEHAPGAGNDEVLSEAEQRREKTRAALRRAIIVQQAPVEEKSYKPVNVTEVGLHLGRWVKLVTYYGRKVEGTLQRVEGKMLYVDQHLEQGSALYPIDKTKLAKLEVLY